MATRLERGLKILLLLQKGVAYDALQLSTQMSVSRRTIFRDMALLKEMGLPIAYDTESACYSYDAGHFGNQFQVEADEMRDFLVSVTVAASEGESLDQDDLRNQVVSFASRLPKPMRDNVAASLETGDGTGRSNACKMRLVVAKLAQAIGYETMIGLTPLNASKVTSGRNQSILVIPRELKCTSEGWTLAATIASANEGSGSIKDEANERETRIFPLRDYTITAAED